MRSAVGLVMLAATNGIALAQGAGGDALAVLATRPGWERLPSGLVKALAERLGSATKATEFVQICEKSGIRNNIARLADSAGDDPDWFLGSIAGSLIGYANADGNAGRYDQARRSLELALVLKPRFVPAWSSLALVAYNLKNCREAVIWADRFLGFKPDPNSLDHWEKAFASAMTPGGERRAAEVLGEPELVGSLKELRAQMMAVKEACRK
jgi:tetratricopeptide (TPR) repeat protein